MVILKSVNTGRHGIRPSVVDVNSANALHASKADRTHSDLFVRTSSAHEIHQNRSVPMVISGPEERDKKDSRTHEFLSVLDQDMPSSLVVPSRALQRRATEGQSAVRAEVTATATGLVRTK